MPMADEHSNSPPYLAHTKRRRLDVNSDSHTNPASLPHDYYNPFQPAPYYPSQFAYGLTPRMHTTSVGAALRAEDASAFSRDPGVRSAMAARNLSLPPSWRAAVAQSAEHVNLPGPTPAAPYLYGNVNAPFVNPLSSLHPTLTSCSAQLPSPSNHVLAGGSIPVAVPPGQLADLSPSHSGAHRLTQNAISVQQPLPPSDIDVVKSLRDVVHELHDIRDMVIVLASKTDSLFGESQMVKTDLSQLSGNVRKLLGYFQGSPSPRGEPQGAELKQPVLVSNGPITSVEGIPMQMSAPDRQVSPPTVPPVSLFATKCANCATTKTPQWRWEDGKRLCNACGLVVRLKKKREQVKKKDSAATTSNFSSPPQSLATALMNSTSQNGSQTVASSAGSSIADDSPVSSDIHVHGSEPDKESTSDPTHTYVDTVPNELKSESAPDEKRHAEVPLVLAAEPAVMDVSTLLADDKMEDGSPHRSVSSAESCSVSSVEESASSAEPTPQPTPQPSRQSTLLKDD
eukprot:GILK01013934.1.p1 GENE.GILK01013934.1~~GILK01013934.1.p1  ORF type:complete len:512 (+),score=63.13 GILK01013934.1:244-1779(+)